jgi:hypothetical protein
MQKRLRFELKRNVDPSRSPKLTPFPEIQMVYSLQLHLVENK